MSYKIGKCSNGHEFGYKNEQPKSCPYVVNGKDCTGKLTFTIEQSKGKK